MNKQQRRRLAELMRLEKQNPDKCWIGYWVSNAQGRSAFGHGTMVAIPGETQRLKGKASELAICQSGGLHATRLPHQWPGCRVFVVALHGKRIDHENKSAARVREIVGEVFPEECLDPRLGLKCGGKLGPSADLTYADLRYADLRYADLTYADLRYADLTYADLRYADLRYADLTYADLRYADLRYADLTYADLRYADLRYADLTGARVASGTTPPAGWELSPGGILVRKP